MDTDAPTTDRVTAIRDKLAEIDDLRKVTTKKAAKGEYTGREHEAMETLYLQLENLVREYVA